MKRIDRILNSALQNNSNKKKKEFLQRDMDYPAVSLGPLKTTPVDNQLENDMNHPATSLAPPMITPVENQLESDMNYPAASLAPPMITPVENQLESDMNHPAASLAPPMITAVENQLESDINYPAAYLAPATITPVENELESDMNHPAASLAPPMITPVENELESDINHPAASLAPPTITPVENQLENDVSSPIAPLYSPLTPLVTAFRMIENQNLLTLTPRGFGTTERQRSEKNSSPLPQMSPKTYELFETLSRTFPSENVDEFVDLDMGKEETLNIKELGLLIDGKKNSESDLGTDFSCDTESDYIPDSEEDSDNSNRRLAKSKRISSKPHVLGSKNRYVPNSEDDSEDETSRSLLEGNEQGVENHEVFLRTSTITNTYVDEETVDDPSNLVQELQDQGLVRQDVPSTTQEGRAKRGRKRKYPAHSLAQKKERKYKNLPYHTKTKKVLSKIFKNYACTCPRKCYVKVSQEIRKNEFEKYIALGSYEAQLLFIVNNVKEEPKARSYTVVHSKTGNNKPRTYRRKYLISDVEVCKDMFLHNFQISSKKIDVSLQKNRSDQSFKDQRGIRQGGWNRTPEEEVEFIKKVINSLPKYESHYRRENNSGCQYLKVGMTVQKIYNIYLEEFKLLHGQSKKPVSFETLKRIFYKSFNLRCKTLKKDTCNKCDTLTEKIKNNSVSADEILKLQKEKEEHLKRAQEQRQKMNEDLLRAKTDETFECLTYDLEKTLPLPRIPTNIIFYKRQLWLYNGGIHAGSTDTGHCNVWLEGEAGRGAQEVGSCLLRYIKTNINANVKELVLWSDCCGGQNRNIKIVLMLKALLNSHPSLKKITFKYLESGHTFLPNDTDFSKIEYQLKYHERIYTAEDYINVMKSCKKKNPLLVYRMEKKDFMSTAKIEKKIVNRKVFITKEKVNWLKTKEISIEKNHKHSIFMKIDEKVKELNIEKKYKGKVVQFSEDDLVLLWPNGKEIAQAKLDDLKSLFHLIPKDCLGFYKSLKGNLSAEDVDGFGAEPDFEVEQEHDVNHDGEEST